MNTQTNEKIGNSVTDNSNEKISDNVTDNSNETFTDFALNNRVKVQSFTLNNAIVKELDTATSQFLKASDNMAAILSRVDVDTLNKEVAYLCAKEPLESDKTSIIEAINTSLRAARSRAFKRNHTLLAGETFEQYISLKKVGKKSARDYKAPFELANWSINAPQRIFADNNNLASEWLDLLICDKNIDRVQTLNTLVDVSNLAPEIEVLLFEHKSAWLNFIKERFNLTLDDGKASDDEIEQPTLDDEIEQPTLDDEIEQPTLDDEIEQSTLDDEIEQSTLDGETEQSTLDGETEQSTLDDEIEQPTLDDEIEQSTLDDEIEQPTSETEQLADDDDEPLIELDLSVFSHFKGWEGLALPASEIKALAAYLQSLVK